MRSIVLECAALSLAVTCSGPAEARRPQSARTVQLIVMDSTRLPTRTPADGSLATEGDSPETSHNPIAPEPTPEAFRTHDLSRRWVEFEMANSFASSTTPPPRAAADQDPFARVGTADIGPSQQPNYILPPPPINIPRWMQGGLAFTAAATRFVPGCAAGGYRPSGFLGLEAEGRRFGYYGMMSAIACEYGIPVGLFDALIIRESRYKADVISAKNAFGLTQLMPDTAVGLGVDRYDVEQNLRGGARYLRQQLDKFGQVHLALAAYNAGPGRVRNGMLPRIAETQSYVDNVLLNWRRLAGLSRVATIQTASAPGAPALPQTFGRTATVSSY
ncbi:transglycosylase SLT domain-containing protein [Sphingomonas psychrotolerans]|uniref:Lytic transglycosylase n=1 Tax=Sphingomonas psychrotolerans TaxID=1327635 RepID=A0A2K8MLY8_9SPHN|nr:transglycosylase SLT domain-containing protein [Sphingomonas psychrotolerans]ATY34850.1 lytic transglycosylase [Sphingomonas psychrotolerans]